MPKQLPELPPVPNPPQLPEMKMPEIPALEESTIPTIPSIPSVADFNPASLYGLISNSVGSIPPSVSVAESQTITAAQQAIGNKLFAAVMGQIIPLTMGLSALASMVGKLAGIIGAMPGKPTLKLPVLPPEIPDDVNPMSQENLEKYSVLVPNPDPQEIIDDALDMVYVKYMVIIQVIESHVPMSDEAKSDVSKLRNITYLKEVKSEYRLPWTHLLVYSFQASLLHNIHGIKRDIEEKVIKGRNRKLRSITSQGIVKDED